MGEPKKLSEYSQLELQKKIRDMYQLKRDTYQNISNCKLLIKDCDNIIDLCEAELRKRGHI